MDNQISHYKIISKIASGGMANVFLALDTTTNTKVAIKILKEEVSAKEKILERFTQEGLLNLNHPNIVKILDAGVHEKTPYIVMEYIEGRDLEALIKDKKRLSVPEALSIFNQLLSALSYIHGLSIIHRDIKPKNILIDKSGIVKLSDFGIAKSFNSLVETSVGGYLGAPAYSSPEQMDRKPLDARSDIYSLGITLYEMLSGVTPFSSTSIPNLLKEKFTGSYRQIGTFRADIPPLIVSVIEKCTAVNPKDRFGSITEIMSALNSSYGSDTFITTPILKTQGSAKKVAFISIVAVAVMLTVIIILAVKLSGRSEDMAAAALSTIKVETTVPETTAAKVAARDKIAFVSDRDGNYEIYIMNIDGSGQARLVSNSAEDWYPSFSPDGFKITFVSNRDGNYQIYSMNTDGSEQTRLTNNYAEEWYPSFSPDGSKIAFMSDRDGNAGLYIMNIDGSEQKRLTNNSLSDYKPSFSPEGSKIAFMSNRDKNTEIYLMNINGMNQSRLTNNMSEDWYPAFSPSGSKIAFMSDRDGNNGIFEIYIMNIDGSGQMNLTNNTSDDQVPFFSPDGSKIAFSSKRSGNNEVYLMNIDGSGVIKLTDNPADDWQPSFSPSRAGN